MYLKSHQQINAEIRINKNKEHLDRLREKLISKGIMSNNKKTQTKLNNIEYNPDIEKIKDPDRRKEARQMRVDGIMSQEEFNENIKLMLKEQN